MLVLSRHRDESIRIGDLVLVTIVDIRGDKVRLGIDAPQHVPVHREEVHRAIEREAAAKAAQSKLLPLAAVELRPDDTASLLLSVIRAARDADDGGNRESKLDAMDRILDLLRLHGLV